MKVLKRIIIALLVIIAIPLIAALFISKDFQSQSEIVIDKPIAEVYDYVKYVKNQDNFGVWQLSDPEMKTSETGTDGTVGFKYSWEGEKTGTGAQSITNLVDNQRVDTELDFNMGEPAKSYFLLEEIGNNQTKVTWGVSGRSPYPWNLMTLFYDMGKDFDKGLLNLKDLLENEVHDDKTFFQQYYQETLTNLSNVVAGLNAEQLHFKAADSVWSISQVLEHILLTEKMLSEHIQNNMAQPANPERRAEIQYSDDEIIQMSLDRSEKYKAPTILIGKGKYSKPQDALDELAQQREELLTFLDSVAVEDLRNHVSDSPSGASDAFQSLLFMAGHTARHTAQIEELKAHPDFPK